MRMARFPSLCIIALSLAGTIAAPAWACQGYVNIWELDDAGIAQAKFAGYIALFASFTAFSACLFWLQANIFRESRKGWIKCSRERSTKHELYGFGGWNIILILALIVTSFVSFSYGYDIRNFSGIGSCDVYSVDGGIFVPVSIFWMASAVHSVICCLLLVIKNRHFRSFYISGIIYIIIFSFFMH